MTLVDRTTTWVRLQRDGVTIFALDRWPGSHGHNSAIYSPDPGWFVFHHLDVTADGGREAIYRPAAT